METPKIPSNLSTYDLDIWAFKAEIPDKIVNYIKELNIFTEESLVFEYIQDPVKILDYFKHLEDFEVERVIFGLETLKDEYRGKIPRSTEDSSEEKLVFKPRKNLKRMKKQRRKILSTSFSPGKIPDKINLDLVDPHRLGEDLLNQSKPVLLELLKVTSFIYFL